MEELLLNLHMHTRYSDGTGTHAEIGKAALASGLDVVIVTDHNILVNGPEGYFQEGKRRVLMLLGEEIHDQARLPQKSHLLVFGAGCELACYAPSPRKLINHVQQNNGMAFIAHPFEATLPLFGETDITWENWEVDGFTGIEIWNGLSEIKNVIHGRLSAAFYAFFPQYIAHGPEASALKKWDELTTSGKKIVAICGSDAHAMVKKLGPFQKIIFPYEFHFRGINNHLLTDTPLTGDLAEDRKMVYKALRQGRLFIGYDLPASTTGFRFNAHGKDQTAEMGDEINIDSGITFRIKLPMRTECRLLKDSQVIKTWSNREICTFIGTQPGVYRVECSIDYLGKSRGWIFSNPIYVYDYK
jgi:hypothetical protein